MLETKCITRTAEINWDDKGFIRIKILQNACIDEDDALDNLLVIKNLSENKKALKLVDLRGKWSITEAAKKISLKNVSPENTVARAYITDSVFSKVMHKFFSSFESPGLPQKFFTSEEEAIAWLLSKKQ